MRTKNTVGLAFAVGALLARPIAAQDDAPCLVEAPGRSAPGRAFEAGGASEQEKTPSVETVREGGTKHFFRAAGELALLEVGPWAFDRYVRRYDFAFISAHTVSENFKTGFQFDHDDFSTNQSWHPYHGSLFFDAARSNGYDFWASGVFALAGSLVWECCMENTAPSINDLVNTTLGGMTRGEVSHRLSLLILDNTSTGTSRLLREIGAGVINPVGSLNRLLNGETGREFPNPEDRVPSVVALSSDLGYRHIGGGALHPHQTTLALSFVYGNPFEGDLARPFDAFWVGVDLNTPGTLASRIEERGVLKGWELTDPSSAIRHVFGFSQEYEYLNNASQVFGAQILSVGLLSRYGLGSRLMAVTDASVILMPLAGIKTVDFQNQDSSYDYAPGGGLRVAGRLYLGALEILGLAYGVGWTRTINGLSDSNTLQFFRSVARFPLAGPIGAGAGYNWYSRKTSYPAFFEPRKTQSEWRVFLDAAFAFR